MSGYLDLLAVRLAAGAARWPEGFATPHANFLRESQRDDGGFAGRDGNSDPYYTSFALRGLALSSGLDENVAAAVTEFLSRCDLEQLPLIDLLSFVYGAAVLTQTGHADALAKSLPQWRDVVIRRIAGQRRDDGGFAKTPQSPKSSTYFTFLATIACEWIERPVDDVEALQSFILSQWREDGGFVEFGPLPRSATNPTAAAIAVLSQLGGLDEHVRDGAVRFLLGMQSEEGGLRANTRIPVADVLSTFTGLLTLEEMDRAAAIDRAQIRRYVEALAEPEGGFRAAVWDAERDVEYTFYGLGAAALLAVE